MLKFKRSTSNETLRYLMDQAVYWIGWIHQRIAAGFLWLCRKVGAVFGYVPWNFRAALLALISVIILIVSSYAGRALVMMCGFTAIVQEEVQEEEEEEEKASDEPKGDEIAEQKLKTNTASSESFSPLGQITAFYEADTQSINPDHEKWNKAKIEAEYVKRYDEAGFNQENTCFSPVQTELLYANNAFRGLNLFHTVGWILAGVLMLGAILSILSGFAGALRKPAWYVLVTGGIAFAIYWFLLIFPMFNVPDVLLAQNLKDFDSEMRNMLWFTYIWYWMPVLFFTFFTWFPLLLSRVKEEFGIARKERETVDVWEKNLTCQGKNPGIYRGTYWTVSYYIFFLLVLPLILHGCYVNDAYLIPKGDGGGVVEQVVKMVKPKKPKKVKKYIFNPNSAILFDVPKMDDKLSEDIDDTTEREIYKPTSIGTIGPGKKGGQAGWPDGMADGKIRFIRLKYRGGDWDQDMGKGADYNMLLKMREWAGFRIADNTESMEIAKLARWKQGKAPPFVYITGSGNINISASEAKQIRKYLLETGGMLFADNGGGSFDSSFRNMLRQILPELPLIDIANDDVIYQSPFLFTNGAPPLFHHSGNGRALGLKYNGRWIVFYHQGDINDAWRTGGSGVSPETQERAYKMGANVIAYAFTQYLAQVRSSMMQGKKK